jgi:hypothetical protein
MDFLQTITKTMKMDGKENLYYVNANLTGHSQVITLREMFA